VLLARDDWGLRDLTAKLSVESLPEQVFELPLPLTGFECEIQLSRPWDFSAELSRKGIVLRPKDQLLLWVEARDHLGQIGKSQIERWTVESPVQQLELIASQQTDIAQQISDLLELQATGQQLAETVRKQLARDPLNQSHVDAASSVVQLQQTLSQQLNEATDGIRHQLQQTLHLLEMNQLTSSELFSQLTELDQRISSDGARQAELAWEKSVEYQTAIQEALNSRAVSADLESAASELNQAQTASLQSLQSLVEQMDSNQALNRLRQELLAIYSQQQALFAATNQVQLDVLRDGNAGLPSQLANFADQQLDLARQLEQWMAQTQQIAQNQHIDGVQDRAASPLRSQLNEASRTLAQSQTTNAMREAGQVLHSEQLGAAITRQQAIDDAFREAVGQVQDVNIASEPEEKQSSKELQSQQIWLLRESLNDLVADQRVLVTAFENLAAESATSNPSIDLNSNSQNLIARQEAIQRSVDTVRDQSDQLPVFQWALDQVANDMAKAVANARRRRLTPDAVLYANDALNKLSALIVSLEPPSQDDTSDPLDSVADQENAESSAESEPSTWAPLASLKLLRSLQWELGRQTQEVSQFSDASRKSARRSELAGQQQELADRLRQVLRELAALPPADAAPNDDLQQGEKP